MTRATWALALAGALLAAGAAGAQQSGDEPVLRSMVACTRPAWLHCPDEDCPGDRVINPGPEVEMESRRTYFLDFPCDLAPGEDVTLVLSLHGGGSYANWQRHYFPLLDHVDRYRLVVLTPSSPLRVWTEADDAYLQGIVEGTLAQLGPGNVRAFWLAGHSQGGFTARRLVCTDFFAAKVDGLLSLSGGRLGGNPGRVDFGFRPPSRPGGPALPGFSSEPPTCDFSHIYTTGRREVDAEGLPRESEWAEKYRCGPRRPPEQVVDERPGYVYDTRRQDPANPAWGAQPAPGAAEVHVYPDCRDDRLVADVVRLDKGHTEGLEPRLTEKLIGLMLAAPGGKLQRGR